MLNIVKAERLKMRHTFGKVLAVAFPVFTLLLVFVLMGGTHLFFAAAWNWWYTLFLPAMLAVLCYLGTKKDGKINYYNMLVTPYTLERCLAGKIIYYSFLLFLANFIIFIGVAVSDAMTNGTSILIYESFLAAILLSVLYLWEIPLYILLSYRFGMFADIFVCVILSMGGTAIFASSRFWWLCPSSIPVRLMCPVLGILPNGLLVPDGSSLYNTEVILPSIVLSLVWFVLTAYLTVRVFKRKVVGE